MGGHPTRSGVNNGTSPEKKKLCPTRGTGGNQQPLHPMPRCHRSPPAVFGHKRPSQRWAWGESTSTFPATMENVWKMYGWLVVSTPLKNFSKLGWLFHILWKNKIHVPNHQPDWRCIASIHPCVRFQGPGPVWKDVRACSTLPSSAFRKSVGLSENLGHRSHYPLLIQQVAIENGPFIVYLPIKDGDFHSFLICLYVYQMVQ